MDINNNDMTQILLDAFVHKFLISLEKTCAENQTFDFIKNTITNFNINNEKLSKYNNIIDKLKNKTFSEIKEMNDIINETVDNNKYHPDINNIVFNLNKIKTLLIDFVINRNEELFDFFHE